MEKEIQSIQSILMALRRLKVACYGQIYLGMPIYGFSKQPAISNTTERVLDVSVPGSEHGIETWRDRVGAVQTFARWSISSPILGADPLDFPGANERSL